MVFRTEWYVPVAGNDAIYRTIGPGIDSIPGCIAVKAGPNHSFKVTIVLHLILLWAFFQNGHKCRFWI